MYPYFYTATKTHQVALSHSDRGVLSILQLLPGLVGTLLSPVWCPWASELWPLLFIKALADLALQVHHFDAAFID